MPVKCEGKHGAADDVAAKEPNFGVKGIHLRFMTTAGYPTRPNPATKCQLTEAKVRLETSKAGGVKFRLWTKVGNQPMQNQFVEAWSKFVGPGKFEATFTKTFTVDKTTTVQAMAEDLTNPIGQSTGWKEVKLDCTGAGGGGFSGTPGNVQSGRPAASQSEGADARLSRFRRWHQGRAFAAPDRTATAAAFRTDQDGACANDGGGQGPVLPIQDTRQLELVRETRSLTRPADPDRAIGVRFLLTLPWRGRVGSHGAKRNARRGGVKVYQLEHRARR